MQCLTDDLPATLHWVFIFISPTPDVQTFPCPLRALVAAALGPHAANEAWSRAEVEASRQMREHNWGVR